MAYVESLHQPQLWEASQFYRSDSSDTLHHCSHSMGTLRQFAGGMETACKCYSLKGGIKPDSLRHD